MLWEPTANEISCVLNATVSGPGASRVYRLADGRSLQLYERVEAVPKERLYGPEATGTAVVNGAVWSWSILPAVPGQALLLRGGLVGAPYIELSIALSDQAADLRLLRTIAASLHQVAISSPKATLPAAGGSASCPVTRQRDTTGVVVSPSRDLGLLEIRGASSPGEQQIIVLLWRGAQAGDSLDLVGAPLDSMGRGPVLWSTPATPRVIAWGNVVFEVNSKPIFNAGCWRLTRSGAPLDDPGIVIDLRNRPDSRTLIARVVEVRLPDVLVVETEETAGGHLRGSRLTLRSGAGTGFGFSVGALGGDAFSLAQMVEGQHLTPGTQVQVGFADTPAPDGTYPLEVLLSNPNSR